MAQPVALVEDFNGHIELITDFKADLVENDADPVVRPPAHGEIRSEIKTAAAGR